MEKLVFVTGNKEKMKEAASILPFPFSTHEMELDEIQSFDLTEVARHKAIQAYKTLKTPLFVDDAGFFINAWDGYPGPFIKFMRRNDNELILRLMTHETNRTGYFQACIAYHNGTTVHTFLGKVPGRLAEAERGSTGWGLDPLFIPDGYDKTFGELGDEVKNKLSHRGQALVEFKTFLENETTH